MRGLHNKTGRVRYIDVPVDEWGKVGVTRLVIFFLAIGGCLWFFSLWLIGVLIEPGAGGIFRYLLLVPAYGIAFLWANSPRRRKVVTKWDFARMRQDRLRTVTAQPEAAVRLPHRTIELSYLEQFGRYVSVKPFIRRATKLALQAALPQTTILVNTPQWARFFVDNPTESPFEPVDVRDVEALGRLFQCSIEQNDLDRSDWPSEFSLADEHEQPEGFRVFRSGFSVFWSVCVTALVLYFLWRRGDVRLLSLVVGFATLFRIRGIIGFFGGTNWWLVPGGVVRIRYRVWQKEDRIQLFTSAEMPLIIDFHKHTGYVNVDGKTVKIPSDWPLLIAWLSRARTPTIEEIRTFCSRD